MKTFVVAKVIGGTERVEADNAEITPHGDLIFGNTRGITYAFATGEWRTFWLEKDA